jgi:hypothetical protein
MNTQELKQALRNGPHAWPGGYPLYFVADDGETLSFDAVRQEFKQIIYSMRHGIRDGWNIADVDVNWEDPDLFCAHTGERIPSAYSED